MANCVNRRTISVLCFALSILTVEASWPAARAQQHGAAGDCHAMNAALRAPAPNGAPVEWDKLADRAASICSYALDRSQPDDGRQFEEEVARVAATTVQKPYPSFNERVLQSIGMVERVTVETLMFSSGVSPEQPLVNQFREAYSQRGLSHHIWFNTPACGVSHDTTDIWWPGGRNGFHDVTLLVESRTSLTLVSLDGNFDTNGDMLFLRGYIGVPNFDACAVSSLESRRPVLSP